MYMVDSGVGRDSTPLHVAIRACARLKARRCARLPIRCISKLAMSSPSPSASQLVRGCKSRLTVVQRILSLHAFTGRAGVVEIFRTAAASIMSGIFFEPALSFLSEESAVVWVGEVVCRQY